MDVNELVGFLESYRGRDKVYRLVCYASSLLSSCAQHAGLPTASERLSKLGAALSSCRIVLRLGDDLSMLLVSTSYGLGKSVGATLCDGQVFVLPTLLERYIHVR